MICKNFITESIKSVIMELSAYSSKDVDTPNLQSVPALRNAKFVIQIGSEWPQMGQIWDFFRSDFSTFLLAVTGIFSEKSRICYIFVGQPDQLWSLIWNPQAEIATLLFCND